MIKCIYRDTEDGPHCNMPADYIYLGKSYCATHLKIRAEEAKKMSEKADKDIEDLKKKIHD